MHCDPHKTIVYLANHLIEYNFIEKIHKLSTDYLSQRTVFLNICCFIDNSILQSQNVKCYFYVLIVISIFPEVSECG